MRTAIKTFMHEVNNKLTHIIASSQLLSKTECLDSKMQDRVKYILDASIEVSKLVEELGKDYNLYNWKD